MPSSIARTFLAVSAAALAAPLASAAPLVSFGFDNNGDIDETTPYSGGDTAVAAGVDLTRGLQIGAGLNPLTGFDRYNFNGVSDADDVAAGSSGVSSAIADDEFFSFIVSADAGSTLDLSGGSVLIENFRKEGNGGRAPDSVALSTSVDGFATVLDSAGPFPFNFQTTTLDIPDTAAYEALTGPVELRVYSFRSTAPTNSDQGGGGLLFEDDGVNNGVVSPSSIVLNGTVNVIPEPASLALLGAGALTLVRRRRA